MPYIKVNINKINGFGNVTSQTRSKVNHIQSSFYSTGSALDWDIKACASINSQISKINNELSKEIASLKRMESFFALAAKKYSNAELEKKAPQIARENVIYTRLVPGSTLNDMRKYQILNLFNKTIKPAKKVNVNHFSERIPYVLDKGWKSFIKSISGKGEISDYYNLTLLVSHLFGKDGLSNFSKNLMENPIVKNITKIGFKSIKPIILARYGYSITKKGGYYFVTGSRKLANINGLTILSPGRYKNIDPKYLKNYFPSAAMKELNSLKSLSAKLAAVEIFVKTGKNIYNNIKNNASVKKIAGDAVVDLAFETPKAFIKVATVAPSMSAGAAIGAAVGSIVPVAGTAVGAVVGAVAGVGISVAADFIIDKVYDGFFEKWKVYEGKSIKEWASEGVQWVIDKAAEGFAIAGQAAIETAQKVGNTISIGAAKAKDTLVEIGKTVAKNAETAKAVVVEKVVDAKNAVDHFAYETGNSIKKGFLNGISNIKNVVTGKALGVSW